MRVRAILLSLLALSCGSCGPRTTAEAEQKGNVAWLAEHATGESIAALGRMADTNPKALAALEARADRDVNVYIASWTAVQRGAAWGSKVLRTALVDPSRSELAASVLPRKEPAVLPFLPDLEAAIVRLSAAQRGGSVAGIVAALGQPARATVERRLVDPKTRGPMCDGIGLPDASAEARAALMAVAPAARDHVACVGVLTQLAQSDDAVVAWIGTTAEIGLLGVAAKSTLPCGRLASIWKRALVDRGPDAHAAMTVPLQRSISRCPALLDPVLAEILARAPRARPVIIGAIDPFGSELAEMKTTCDALRDHARGESAAIRERAEQATLRGCRGR